jgi:Holliday junction DNA helicase RuvA
MIAHLSGTLTSKKNGRIVVDVAGVGYELRVSLVTLAELPQENSKIKILTYQHFRETGTELFGFWSEFEKELFLLLIDVPGIGTRTAMEILSNVTLAGFKKAVIAQDIRTISSIKGIGKKTAEKLVFELKDKMREFYIPESGAAADRPSFEEAVAALRALGFTYIQAKEAVENVVSCSAKDIAVPEMVRGALKILGK